MTTEVKDVIVLLRARRVPGKWSDTVTRDPLLQDAADLLEAAESRATAAEGRVALLEEERENLAQFARWIIAESAFSGSDVGGDEVQEEAVKRGLIALTSYDPASHGPSDVCDPGDDWYEFTARARLAKGGQ